MINIARKKPVEVEVCQWTGKNVDEIKNFCGHNASFVMRQDGGIWFTTLDIFTLEGTHYADFGDYIIKGVKGEFYPCKPDIFEKTYDIIK
jgi:hypothetical protein